MATDVGTEYGGSGAAEVAVVGAGPIGLELAVALKRAGIDYLHFDAQQVGHTISWFPPQTRFFSSNERIAIAGVPLQTPDQGKCTREQYLAYLRGVVQQFDLRVNAYEPVVGIDREPAGGFRLTTAKAGSTRSYRARRVVLVTGGTDRPRRLGVPGEDLSHVVRYFDEPHRYFRQRVLIVGGKNSAVEAALRCYNAGAHVSLSYRRGQLSTKSIKYWLLPEINGLIEAGKIGGYFGTVPAEITPARVRLVPSEFAREAGGAGGNGNGRMTLPPGPVDVPADFVLSLIGYEQDGRLLELAGVERRGECRTPVFDPATMETNVPGVHVAGTAVGGTQDKYTVFIENCHVHVDRIVAALTGGAAPAAPAPLALPES